MKKTLSLLLAVCLLTWLGAQEDPAKDLKKVSRNLANYNLDPVANANAITESVALIEGVVKSSEYEKDGKAWLLYGNVYGEIVNGMTQALVLDPNAEITSHEAVAKTFKGYSKAIEYAVKSYDKKDAVSGLKGSLPNMYYVANTILTRQEYVNAYPAYGAVAEGELLLEANGDEGIFSKEELQNAQFVTAVCALSSERNDEAVELLMNLKKENYNDAGVYEYLHKAYLALGRSEDAEAILNEGRTKFPDDKGLLFAEINAALAKGDLGSLVDKLKIAMEAEPENISVPTTLGNVYDQLYQKALAAGDMETAHSHYENARLYIGKALEINPDHFDAVYMMGALEYNKAAELANEVNKLADDYSKEGTKKYNEKQAEMMAQFDKALPHFEKAESLNPDDSNTLLALKEIWARKGDFEKSNAYKEKLERIIGN
jgi:tetratricopeptide (TPR) repeat protein